MLSHLSSVVVLLSLLHQFTVAQYPAEPIGIKVLQSRFGEGITISYKENEICETTPGVRSYSGHVHLPPGTAELGQGQDYPINTFFWFFEARSDPTNAPLSIWLNGGPGSSSMFGLFAENGPCFVNADSNSTRLSEWSWNNEVNMLYLDQPVQVGFSYDTLQNVIRNLINNTVVLLNETDVVPPQNTTLLTGTFPSRVWENTAFGSRNGAIAAWHFAQAWFQEFPGYQPNDTRVSLAAQSYGGRYGPAMMTFFEEQNQRIENGTWDGSEGEQFIIHLDTLMIISGCIDRYVQWPYYPEMAFRGNGYGIEAVNETTYNNMTASVPECLRRIQDCRDIAAESDPDSLGINSIVNEVCEDAETWSPFHEGFLNREWVQAELGVPLNWTGNSPQASRSYRSIGDYPRDSWLGDIGFLLDNGIKVSLVHGDLDFACPWNSGDAVAKAINWTGSAGYAEARYAEIQTNDSYIGGLVRQHGNLSFIRTYQAGHEIPSYQPETAYKIFTRALFNRDIATGLESTAGNFTSSGRKEPDVQLGPTGQKLTYCYTYAPSGTCQPEQIEMLVNGTAEICNWIVIDANSTQLFPEVIAQCRAEWAAGSGGSNGTNAELPAPSTTPYTGDAGKISLSRWYISASGIVTAIWIVML
ncbi:Putative peptidase S10, serine carboxypeptidase, alpha/Beta hydrolase [Septoria linicola]|uniref:Peptidase S10, serine carboxypeptidase, alpha/Beta hydrolase n=1 Tax=Septoria linicola TaxID=215465 RepID=A0A9Q9AWD5_9PEZI|nr:putative peptidase S10, serine carboxypeptidase, alpha/Beta hydrolase [Septoria linicola]USW53172.1 Putative peptidase S10, serine carboxypeptidase, alpha/Beta hydrolase [Septoria linicola]